MTVPPRPRARVAALCIALAFAAPAFASPDEPADALAAFIETRSATEAPAPVERTPSMMARIERRAAEMVVSAMHFIGVRYARGGDSEATGFDCSGFTQHVFRSALGFALPRSADAQAASPGLAPVARADLQPGDLVFFNTLRREFSHVGIYIGGDRFIHAPSRGKDVRTEDMRQAYWTQRFTGARRAVALADD